MTLTAEQLKARQRGVGGSDASCALNLNPWKSSIELYEEKRAPEPVFIEPNEAMAWGHRIEPLLRQFYADTTGREVCVPDTLWSEEYPWMLAHLDGVADDRGFEAKVTRSGYGWGEPGSDQIPQHYVIQTQHCMVVAKLAVFDICVLIGGVEARLYEIPADRELQELIIEGERAFQDCVESGTPPEIDLNSPRALEIVRKLYAGTSGEILTASEHLEHWRAVYEDATAAENRYQSVANGAKAHLLAAMGEASELRFIDGKALRRRLQKRKAYTVQFPETNYIDARWVSIKD